MYFYRYTNDKELLLSNFNVPLVDAPELNTPGEEVEVLTHAWFNVRIYYSNFNTFELYFLT